jgi:hypothetical protein
MEITWVITYSLVIIKVVNTWYVFHEAGSLVSQEVTFNANLNKQQGLKNANLALVHKRG